MSWVLAIPLLPAAAFALTAPMSRAMRNRAMWVSLVAMAGSLALSLLAFAQVVAHGGQSAPAYHAFVPFGAVGGAVLTFGLLLDPASAAMLLVVTIVGICVEVYSLGYMHRDERRGWFFSVISLFTAAMLVVVLADNFLQLYMAWEVMGLCSYLLIGFWHEEEGPRQASLKAFLVTRVGDVGFAIGLAVMFATSASFNYDTVLGGAAHWPAGVATLCAFLLLAGAAGKSAQVPLHVWLPDAMAGPTPASALIHAATMVAAGVYLVYRALPIFTASGVALTATLFMGLVTALVGGVLALFQYDVKKVLAYSTISQLGLMFVALGAGSGVAALYHLTTHAFFKSLLFLGAGVIIHATHTQDMRQMGGLGRRLPLVAASFTVGALSLAGVFPFSGFFSKDEVLAALLEGRHYTSLALALVAAFITAFYVTRLWVRVFLGEPKNELTFTHGVMVWPMAVLAFVSMALSGFSPTVTAFYGGAGKWPELVLGLVSTAVAVGGMGLGWWVYGLGRIDTRLVRRRLGFIDHAVDRRLFLDELYYYAFVRPYAGLAHLLALFDTRVIDGLVNAVAALWRGLAGAGGAFDLAVIDGVVNGAADSIVATGGTLRRLQTGRVQSYQRLILGALLVLMLVVLWKGA